MNKKHRLQHDSISVTYPDSEPIGFALSREQNPIPALFLAKDCAFAGCNTAFERLIGRSPEKSDTFESIVSQICANGEALEKMTSLLTLAQESEDAVRHIRCSIIDADNHERDMLVSANAVHNFTEGGNTILYTFVDANDYKRAEMTLGEDAVMFHEFIEHIDGGIFLTRRDGAITEWNPAMETITGIPHEEALNGDIRKWLHIEDGNGNSLVTVLSRLIAANKECSPDKETFKHNGALRVCVARHDGVKRTVMLNVFTLGKSKNAIICGIVRDVTEIARSELIRAALHRLRAEVLIMRSVDDIELVLKEISGALYSVGISYKVAEINIIEPLVNSEKYSVKAFQITPYVGWRTSVQIEEIQLIVDFWKKGMPVYRKDIVGNDSYGERDLIEGLYGGQIRSVVDVPFTHGTFAINSELQDAFTEEDIQFFTEIALLLSEGFRRLDDIRSLRHSEELYRTLVEQPSDIIVILFERIDVLRYISPQLYNLTGIHPYTTKSGEALFHDILHPDDYNLVASGIKSAFGGESARNFEFRCRKSDGGFLWFSGTILPILDSSGKVHMVQAIFHDIGDRKQAEEQIRHSLEEKEILLREIHHRVKNNMQVISSLLMLQAECIKDDYYVGVFRESINRIQTMALIHTMLYQSQNLSLIDINDYITGICSNIGNLFFDMTHRITLLIDAPDIKMKMDSAIPCGLIVNELVTNSYKHAFPDKRSGTISITACKSEDDSICLSIADDGIGLPENFDFRNTCSLGLKIVNLLASYQLGGSVELNKSEGTAFTITFSRYI